MKLNKSEDQQQLLRSIEKTLRAEIEKQLDSVTTRILVASITVEPLAPTGWGVKFNVSLQVSPIDKKVEAHKE